MSIESYRKQINSVDAEILKLLKKRFEISKKIGLFKKKSGMKIFDRKREREIISRLVEKSKLNKNFIKKLYLVIFRESRRLQK